MNLAFMVLGGTAEHGAALPLYHAWLRSVISAMSFLSLI